MDSGADGWLDAGGGYQLGVREGRIVARNAKGKELASVPKELKGGDLHASLVEALDWLEAHSRSCQEQAELWMLRSLPVPTALLRSVWEDEAWRSVLENLVVSAGGEVGLLKGVGPQGLGLVNLDGDSRWYTGEVVAIPHPILLAELDDWRQFLVEAGLRQGLSQLYRETFVPTPSEPEASAVDQWSGAEFDRLMIAIGEARRGGWRVRGGSACCAVHEGGRMVEARYDLGEGDPAYETTTGSLWWADTEGRALLLKDVGPVAWSEGMRMAAAIHAKRKVEEKEADDV